MQNICLQRWKPTLKCPSSFWSWVPLRPLPNTVQARPEISLAADPRIWVDTVDKVDTPLRQVDRAVRPENSAAAGDLTGRAWAVTVGPLGKDPCSATKRLAALRQKRSFHILILRPEKHQYSHSTNHSRGTVNGRDSRVCAARRTAALAAPKPS